MKIPCEECLCYVMCKRRLINHKEKRFDTGSISEIAWRENCNRLKQFFHISDQDDINKARILFSLEPLQ